MSPTLKRWSATACCTLGLGLSVHLALLKYYSLPCLGSKGCLAIIHSGYGSVLGVPVGVYGALLWLGVILVPDRTKRGALLTLLAAGAAIFMGIQFLVLRGFCLYCTLHAVVAWLALALHGETPKKWSVLLGFVLAFGGFWIARSHASANAENASAVVTGAGPLAASPAAVTWLGPLTPRSPALVISLNCAACLDLLNELGRRKYADVRSGPAMFFKVTDENRDLTVAFVSAVLSQPGSKREAFLAASAVLLSLQDQVFSSPKTAAAQFAAMFPNAAGQREQAERLLDAQTQTLRSAHADDLTPLFVPITGKPRAFFRADELF